MKTQIIMLLSLLFSLQSFAEGVIVLRCENLENKTGGMTLFEVTLAEELLEKNANQSVEDSSMVKVLYQNGQKAFATEMTVFRYDRNPNTSKFVIGAEEDGTGGFLRIDRTQKNGVTSYRALVLQDKSFYNIHVKQSSDCVITKTRS